MKKNGFIVVFAFLFMIFGTSSFFTYSADNSIKLLTAYATSATADSTPVTALLDLTKEGSWKPLTKDSGSNEGLFFEFAAPVLIDWIEVKLKGGADVYLDYYLDGQKNIYRQYDDEDSDSGVSNKIQFSVVFKNKGKNGIFYLGAEKDYNASAHEPCGPLNSKIKSVFIKIQQTKTTPQIVAVRFYRKNIKSPLKIDIPKYVIGAVQVSSTLSPETAYGLHNLFDSKLDFAWATDGNKTNGIGERIQIQLKNPQNLSGIRIWNGYQRSETHYYANARPAEISVKINDKAEFSLSVADELGVQELRFPKLYPSVKELSLKITDIYKGKKYKDMVISELKLTDEKGSSMILALPPPKIRTTNPELKRLMDISVAPFMFGFLQSQENEYGDFNFGTGLYPHRSIRLRSNGSFVGYFENGDIIEGNWEPVMDGVRIFGKKYATVYSTSPYIVKIKQDEDTVKIFQETIKVLDITKLPFSQVKKYLKTILAERHFYEISSKSSGDSYKWQTGLSSGPISGNNEEQLLAACYKKAVVSKAFLLVSPLLTDVFLASDNIRQVYEYDESEVP